LDEADLHADRSDPYAHFIGTDDRVAQHQDDLFRRLKAISSGGEIPDLNSDAWAVGGGSGAGGTGRKNLKYKGDISGEGVKLKAELLFEKGGRDAETTLMSPGDASPRTVALNNAKVRDRMMALMQQLSKLAESNIQAAPGISSFLDSLGKEVEGQLAKAKGGGGKENSNNSSGSSSSSSSNAVGGGGAGRGKTDGGDAKVESKEDIGEGETKRKSVSEMVGDLEGGSDPSKKASGSSNSSSSDATAKPTSDDKSLSRLERALAEEASKESEEASKDTADNNNSVPSLDQAEKTVERRTESVAAFCRRLLQDANFASSVLSPDDDGDARRYGEAGGYGAGGYGTVDGSGVGGGQDSNWGEESDRVKAKREARKQARKASKQAKKEAEEEQKQKEEKELRKWEDLSVEADLEEPKDLTLKQLERSTDLFELLQQGGPEVTNKLLSAVSSKKKIDRAMMAKMSSNASMNNNYRHAWDPVHPGASNSNSNASPNRNRGSVSRSVSRGRDRESPPGYSGGRGRENPGFENFEHLDHSPVARYVKDREIEREIELEREMRGERQREAMLQRRAIEAEMLGELQKMQRSILESNLRKVEDVLRANIGNKNSKNKYGGGAGGGGAGNVADSLSNDNRRASLNERKQRLMMSASGVNTNAADFPVSPSRQKNKRRDAGGDAGEGNLKTSNKPLSKAEMLSEIKAEEDTIREILRKKAVLRKDGSSSSLEKLDKDFENFLASIDAAIDKEAIDTAIDKERGDAAAAAVVLDQGVGGDEVSLGEGRLGGEGQISDHIDGYDPGSRVRVGGGGARDLTLRAKNASAASPYAGAKRTRVAGDPQGRTSRIQVSSSSRSSRRTAEGMHQQANYRHHHVSQQARIINRTGSPRHTLSSGSPRRKVALNSVSPRSPHGKHSMIMKSAAQLASSPTSPKRGFQYRSKPGGRHQLHQGALSEGSHMASSSHSESRKSDGNHITPGTSHSSSVCVLPNPTMTSTVAPSMTSHSALNATGSMRVSVSTSSDVANGNANANGASRVCPSCEQIPSKRVFSDGYHQMRPRPGQNAKKKLSEQQVKELFAKNKCGPPLKNGDNNDNIMLNKDSHSTGNVNDNHNAISSSSSGPSGSRTNISSSNINTKPKDWYYSQDWVRKQNRARAAEAVKEKCTLISKGGNPKQTFTKKEAQQQFRFSPLDRPSGWRGVAGRKYIKDREESYEE
jgi:hypothetical protein